MVIANEHAYSAPVVGSDSGGPNAAAVIAVNPSSIAITTQQQLTLSEPWVNAGENGAPTIGTAISEPVIVGSTSLTISSDVNFPIQDGYPNIHQPGVGIVLPEIGRLAGAVIDNTQLANVVVTGSVPRTAPFTISINGVTYLVNSVSSSSDGNSAVFTIDSSTPIYTANCPDLSPVHLTSLEIGSTYRELNAP